MICVVIRWRKGRRVTNGAGMKSSSEKPGIEFNANPFPWWLPGYLSPQESLPCQTEALALINSAACRTTPWRQFDNTWFPGENSLMENPRIASEKTNTSQTLRSYWICPPIFTPNLPRENCLCNNLHIRKEEKIQLTTKIVNYIGINFAKNDKYLNRYHIDFLNEYYKLVLSYL